MPNDLGGVSLSEMMKRVGDKVDKKKIEDFVKINEQAKETAERILDGKIVVRELPKTVGKKYFNCLVNEWIEKIKKARNNHA